MKRGLLAFLLVLIIFIIQIFPLTLAEEVSSVVDDEIKIKDFNEKLIDYAQGTFSLSLNEIFNIALERKNLMESLAKTYPDSFLGLVLSEEVRNNLPSDVRLLVEKPINNYENSIDVIVIDKEEGEGIVEEIVYALDLNYNLLEIYFKNLLEKPSDSRDIVRFSGYVTGSGALSVIVIDNIEFLLRYKESVNQGNHQKV